MTTYPNEDQARLLRELKRMRIDAEIFKALFVFSPTPTWYKVYRNNDFIMAAVNAAYSQATGISLPAYRGQRDEAVWPRETADRFYEKDRLVVRRRALAPIAEPARHPVTGEAVYWVGATWPHMRLGAVVGVFGKAQLWPQAAWQGLSSQTRSMIAAAP